MCKNIFEKGILREKNLSTKEIKEFIDKQNFINWDLFVNLVNLESKLDNSDKNSLQYLIRSKSFELIEFMLDCELDLGFNIINWEKQNINILDDDL